MLLPQIGIVAALVNDHDLRRADRLSEQRAHGDGEVGRPVLSRDDHTDLKGIQHTAFKASLRQSYRASRISFFRSDLMHTIMIFRQYAPDMRFLMRVMNLA